MTQNEFKNAFHQLTGNPPFPWQSRLYDCFANGPRSMPTQCDIPTGLGKTSVIAIWLLAREMCPSLPRRLVYVVNRRTVVDQTTHEVEQIRENLPKIGKPKDYLAISTLRGQFADNREWSADPSRTAVICGTVDMIGSRLLFNGYGVGFKGKPLHAGFLGQDSLIVHDEAHLEPAFQDLLVAIQKEQCEGRFPDRHPLHVLELSATSRAKVRKSETTRPFELTKDDYDHAVVKKRVHATKKLNLIRLIDPKISNQLAKIAIDQFKDSGEAVLIFTRTIDDVKLIADSLAKAKLPFEQLIGPMRGLERDRLTDPRDEKGSSIFARFLPSPKADAPEDQQWKITPKSGTVYLICTSAGEVGINISADHLVCDLSTFESMVQRFGRVNRFGLCDHTQIHIVHPTEFDEKDKLSPARKKTMTLLGKLNGDASPAALGDLNAEDWVDAFAPLPIILPVTDILFDAWSMTSIRGKMPGRPSVEPYLHGIRDWEPPETQVAWREEVGVIVGDMLEKYLPQDLLDDYPLKPHELLRDRTDRVWKELSKLAGRNPHMPAWIMDDQGGVEVIQHISEITNWDRKQAESRIGGKTVLLPHDIGGLTEQGMLNGDFSQEHRKDQPPVAINNDVADAGSDENGKWRVRIRVDYNRTCRAPTGMKPVCRILFSDPMDEEGEFAEKWLWFVRLTQADAGARSRTSYNLDPHLIDAKNAAEEFLSGLSLDSDLRDAVILAAACHDLGKDRPRWQRGIGNNRYYEGVKWAKGNRWGMLERSAYRHEFGSILDIQNLPAFKALSEDSREFVLHLIAAHHGRARPHFTPEECLDENHAGDVPRQQSIETLKRFARLQRKFGRWGLAYIESLVRAADYAASELADKQSAGGAR